MLPWLFDFKVDNINLANIFRAMMGLYLTMSAVWIMGIVKPRLWTTATITNITFMGGLALGRLVSLASDGVPGKYFLTGLVLELVLAIWGIINLKKYGTDYK
jgi:thiol:disulfide interchange protein